MPHRAAVIEQPASPYLMTLRKELKGGLHSIGVMPLGDLTADICYGGDSLWAIVRRPRRGGLAIRLTYAPGMELKYGSLKRSKRGFSLTAETALGTYAIAARLDGTDLHRLRLTITLVPSSDLLLPFVPRDLYPLDENDDPLGASGTIEAGQRGLNSGLLYFSIDKPAFGSVLYFQNLTALNDYFTLTGTKPDGVVGGEWPEIGYFLPTSIQSGTPPINPLPAGRKVTLSDAIIVFRDAPAQNECESARLFVQMLGAVYTALELPERDFRDWVDRAEQTLRDLSQSPVRAS